ncbi:Sec-independent protein translocase subunit TatA [Stackebrandtia nassauensis]|uniref:Sec-independent protein translocase protein TatA n=1 Tax=Stackebrandtia nassauensis (strain DSM 44728 / CIP 108903 / NRRL B-16338 / NBRC 102104 / LLR-40K-21) TaxID=446470 RepID=D3Q549_STANL|nr:Sec-independent protein translocase subunit TatA [Stackebrandtia nassauensis]ADD44098.1 sec-independent translocation protein mttA/Hcf106 [Stackebrandtia nassauensis DSM 44728]
MGAVRPWHIIVLVVVLVLLFGAKKLPGAARGLGQSLRILKSETKNLRDDDEKSDDKAEAKHGREPLENKTIEGETSAVEDLRDKKKA